MAVSRCVRGGLLQKGISPWWPLLGLYNRYPIFKFKSVRSLQWRHNVHDGVSNHQPHHCLLNRLSRCRSKKTSKLRVTGLCEGNSPVTSEFPAQMSSNAENVSIWWRHHVWAVVTKLVGIVVYMCVYVCYCCPVIISTTFNLRPTGSYCKLIGSIYM